MTSVATNDMRTMAAEAQLRLISPPPAFLAEGARVVADRTARMLRWVGEQSFCRNVGRKLGGHDEAAAQLWVHIARPDVLQQVRDSLVYISDHSLILSADKMRRVLEWASGEEPLLDPSTPEWALLRAAARELHRLATEELPGTAEEQNHQRLCSCWAWCVMPEPPTPSHQAHTWQRAPEQPSPIPSARPHAGILGARRNRGARSGSWCTSSAS